MAGCALLEACVSNLDGALVPEVPPVRCDVGGLCTQIMVVQLPLNATMESCRLCVGIRHYIGAIINT